MISMTCRSEMSVELVVPDLLGHLRDIPRNGHSHDVDHASERAEPPACVLNEPLDRGRLGNVPGPGRGGGVEFGHHRLDPRLVESTQMTCAPLATRAWADWRPIPCPAPRTR
jgi:hypothetical protein